MMGTFIRGLCIETGPRGIHIINIYILLSHHHIKSLFIPAFTNCKWNHTNLFQWNVWLCVIKTLKLTNKTEIYFRKYAALLYRPLWGLSTQISVNKINHRILKDIFMLNYTLLSSPIYVNILSLPYIIFIPWNRMLPGDWAINWTCFVVNFFWPFDHMHVKTAHSIWQANLILLITLFF